MIELRQDRLDFSFPEVHQEARASISLIRTLRIPDDNRHHPLPPGFSSFPLHHVDDFASRLPADWRGHGGVFFPMYQAEAMWLSFMGSYPMAVSVAAGKVDAVTGEKFSNELHSDQNYVVIPDQPWLDGFCVREGLIRQFVAMPLGEGYTAEEQLTGEAEHGGLQLVVHPMKASRYERLREAPHGVDAPGPLYDLPESRADMGLAPGGLMRQEIFEDHYGLDAWDTTARSRCFVHILNSAEYVNATGTRPPHEPPTAEDYTRAGLPWFEYYDADRKALAGAGQLAKLTSVAAKQNAEGNAPPEGNPSLPGYKVVELGPKRQVREGRF